MKRNTVIEMSQKIFGKFLLSIAFEYFSMLDDNT